MDRKFLHEYLEHDLTKHLGKPICILGCGAIGANLAISMARRGFGKFMLVDDDRIEEYNISTQPWNEIDLNSGKAQILASKIAEISHSNRPYSLTKRIVASTDLFNWFGRINVYPEVIVDCFDNSESRDIAQSVFIELKYDVLHAGMSSENTGQVSWAENYTVPSKVELADPCNYPLSRTLIELTVVVTSEALLAFFLNKEKMNYVVNANTLKISTF